MSSARRKNLPISLLIVSVCLFTRACFEIVTVADPHPQIQLHEPHLCRELASEEDTALTWENIQASETKICVCGELETGDEGSYWLQIRWYEGKNEIEQSVIRYKAGAFITCLRREQGFDPGQYSMDILAGKKQLFYQEFTIVADP